MGRDEILRVLHEFKERSQDRYGISRLGLFGSGARDKMSENSDVDVVVEIAKPDMFALIGIKQDLEKGLNRPVDVVRYRDAMGAFLKDRIDREAIYV